ncbi:MAG TPA: glycerophosphodiester phosphodiesterase family protein [Novosphingobium sp.]|nr:glycerophosphodiester phosphodiesterase family protein [Novosphingobium sp.]
MTKAIFALAALACTVPASLHAADTNTIMRRIRDPQGGLIAIAHRGCHEPAPWHGWGSAPENSALALDRCAQMGVEVMETDVHKTRDGYLVIMHDDTVDRMTEGKGAIETLTLAQIKALHLRANEGGPAAPLSDQTILTLEEMLALAKGRIVLNLDVKAMVYAEVVDAVMRAGAQERVIVKTTGGLGSAPLASMAPFDKVPFAVIPTSADERGVDIPEVMQRQAGGPVRPIAFELPLVQQSALPAIGAQAQRLKVRLWVNTLFNGFVIGGGNDVDALRMPDAVWGDLYRRGVTMIQTDDPEALLRFREASHLSK